LSVAAVLAACASDEPVGVVDDDAGIVAQGDSGTPSPDTKPDAATSADSGSTQKCVASCAADQDCQKSCPSVQNGVNCCDTATGVCFSSQTQQCPVPPQDSGSPPPVY
jgi:hypothetical protein